MRSACLGPSGSAYVSIWAGYLLGSSLYRHAYRESDADTHSNPCWSVGSCKKGNADTYPDGCRRPGRGSFTTLFAIVLFVVVLALDVFEANHEEEGSPIGADDLLARSRYALAVVGAVDVRSGSVALIAARRPATGTWTLSEEATVID